MKYFNVFMLLFTVLLFSKCTPTPEPIIYGEDSCHFCSMTIVDKLHSAELVTKKSKVYKFDAVECMVNHMKEIDCSKVELFLVNGFTTPEQLIDAGDASFLISEQLPSPMGANLTAFKKKEDAELFQKKKTGKIYSWNDLISYFKDRDK